MAIDKVTAQQFIDKIRAAVLERTTQYDTAVGPFVNTIIIPMAVVFENQNDRVRLVSQLLSRENLAQFTDADVDAYVANEGMQRQTGGRASATVVFIRSDAPTADITIPRNFPIGTQPDSVTGETIVFVTTEAATMSSANPGAYFTGTQYELEVPVAAVVEGSSGIVAPGRITQPLRPLVGFTSVTNRSASTNAPDPETNEELDARYNLAITGRQLGGPAGVERYIKDTYTGIDDLLVVYGSDPALTRAASTSGAVDVFEIGTETLQVTAESVTYVGPGQVIALAKPPIVDVSLVKRISDNTVYTVGTQYEVVHDTSGASGSTRGVDGIRFLSSGSSLPTAGDALAVTYTYNNLVRTIQADFDTNEEVLGFGSDVLIREGDQIDVVISANVKVLAGFDPAVILPLAAEKVLDYVNALSFGEPLEESDIQAVVRAISGVDNWITTKLALVGETGTDDITATSAEYIRTEISAITLTAI